MLQLRAFLGVCALTLFFYAMKFMDVADALLIDSTSPIFVHIFAYGFLQEKCAISQVFATVLAIAGIGFVARPPLLTGDTQYNADVLVRFYFFKQINVITHVITFLDLENINNMLGIRLIIQYM